MSRVLILGGGFGGLAAAHTLKALRPDDEIIVVDQARHFTVGFRKTWALLGLAPLDAGQGDLAGLEAFGITFRQGLVTAILPEARAVEVDGRRLEADAIVVALGARLAGDEIAGFEQFAHNPYDPAAIARVREALHHFAGGRVLIGIFGLPYKCPPAPYEIAILTKEFFDRRGIEATVEFFTPQPMSLPILGAAGCNVIEGHLASNDIAFFPNHKATAVEEGQVIFESGSRPFDLLLGIPPHRCPQVVVESGLTQGGAWVPVDPKTLETAFPGVYAIGDVTMLPMANGKPLPKAGVFAEAEGRVVAFRIAAILEERAPEATFNGLGGCFLEVGKGQAMMVEGDFLAQPAPVVSLTGPSEAYLAQKHQFEAERLAAWFPQG